MEPADSRSRRQSIHVGQSCPPTVDAEHRRADCLVSHCRPYPGGEMQRWWENQSLRVDACTRKHQGAMSGRRWRNTYSLACGAKSVLIIRPLSQTQATRMMASGGVDLGTQRTRAVVRSSAVMSVISGLPSGLNGNAPGPSGDA